METQTATHLRVQVCEGSKTKVDLTFPARAVDNLEDLVPEHVRGKVKDREIDLRELAAKIADSGYAMGPVLSFDTEDREISIWLE